MIPHHLNKNIRDNKENLYLNRNNYYNYGEISNIIFKTTKDPHHGSAINTNEDIQIYNRSIQKKWSDIGVLQDFYVYATVQMGMSPIYAENCCIEAFRFRKYCYDVLNITTLENVETKHCLSYLQFRSSTNARNKKSPPKPATIKSIRNRIHAVSKYHITVGNVTKNKSEWEDIKGLRVTQQYIPPPTEEQVSEAIISASYVGSTTRIRLRNHALIYFMAFTGVRVSELIKINKDQIFQNQTVLRQITILGKGNKERIIGIPNTIIDPLTSYIKVRKDIDPCLFSDSSGDRMTSTAIRSVMREVKKQVNMRNIAPINASFGAHALRRFCFSQMVKNGVPLNIIKELGGWSTYTAMEHYIHYSNMENASKQHSDMYIMDTSKLTPQMDFNF